MTEPMIKVAGYCPMGCGNDTLRLMPPNGVVICINESCPGPMAAAQILADPESEHIVDFKVHEFSIRHPLRERLGDALLDCGLHELLRQTRPQDLPRHLPGRWHSRWRARWRDDPHGGEVSWERL